MSLNNVIGAGVKAFFVWREPGDSKGAWRGWGAVGFIFSELFGVGGAGA